MVAVHSTNQIEQPLFGNPFLTTAFMNECQVAAQTPQIKVADGLVTLVKSHVC